MRYVSLHLITHSLIYSFAQIVYAFDYRGLVPRSVNNRYGNLCFMSCAEGCLVATDLGTHKQLPGGLIVLRVLYWVTRVLYFTCISFVHLVIHWLIEE